MGDLKPIGSEKLTGQDKIKRIMEIARFNEVIPEKINETAKKAINNTLKCQKRALFPAKFLINFSFIRYT